MKSVFNLIVVVVAVLASFDLSTGEFPNKFLIFPYNSSAYTLYSLESFVVLRASYIVATFFDCKNLADSLHTCHGVVVP